MKQYNGTPQIAAKVSLNAPLLIRQEITGKSVSHTSPVISDNGNSSEDRRGRVQADVS